MIKKTTIFLSLALALCLNQTQIQANSCEPCSQNYWGSAEYLFWKIKDSPKPVPFAVTGPAVVDGTPVTDYEVILGGKSIDIGWRSGGKFTLGCWLDDCQSYGGEVNYFFLPNSKITHSVFSDGSVGSDFITLPYYNVITEADSSVSIAVPQGLPGFTNPFAGYATLSVSNSMQGVEVNGFRRCDRGCGSFFDILLGFRYLNFKESLTFSTSSPALPPSAPDVFVTKERFKTDNNFYGGQIGFGWETSFCNRYFFNVKAKLTLGVVNEALDITGKLVTNDYVGFDPNPPVTYVGGYFAQPSNMGYHTKNKFAVLPEIKLSVGYHISHCLKLQLGYTFLYLSEVLYATKQVNPNINISQSTNIQLTDNGIGLVGQASPKPSFKSSGLWAQGLNVGLEYAF